MTLKELKSKLPAELQPWVVIYGPAFLAMTAQELQAWLWRIVNGDVYNAYADVLKKLPNADLLAEWRKISSDWQTANVANKAKNDLAKASFMGLMKILLTIGLAAAGVSL